jgi:hypothetical protein
MSKEKQLSTNLLPRLNEHIERDEKFQARRSERTQDAQPTKIKKKRSVTDMGHKITE